MFSKSTGKWAEGFIWAVLSSNTGQGTGCLHSFLFSPVVKGKNKGFVS
jgi:hypothetical protein